MALTYIAGPSPMDQLLAALIARRENINRAIEALEIERAYALQVPATEPPAPPVAGKE